MTDKTTALIAETIERMGKAAEHYFAEGECCSEAMVHAAMDVFATDLPQEAVPMMAGLCGGMGNKKATCGVFTGGAVALGMVASTQGSCIDKKELKNMSSQFHESLEQAWGGQLCGELLDNMGIRNWDRSRCRSLTRQGAELTAKLLLQNKDK